MEKSKPWIIKNKEIVNNLRDYIEDLESDIERMNKQSNSPYIIQKDKIQIIEIMNTVVDIKEDLINILKGGKYNEY